MIQGPIDFLAELGQTISFFKNFIETLSLSPDQEWVSGDGETMIVAF